MPTSQATNGTSQATNGDSQDLPRRLSFSFQIELKDIQGETLAAGIGFDSIPYDQLYERILTELARRALDEVQKEARAMASLYPATDYAVIRINQSVATNAVCETVHITPKK